MEKLTRFSVAPLTLPDEAEGAVFALVERFEGVRMPAPEFVRGVTEVLAHDRGGHRSYLMGQGSEHGWWYYFPVALLVKTPIPFLVLLVLSPVVLGRRETWRALAPWAAGIAILGIAMTSSINIGIRHVLPLYPLFAVAAGGAAAAIARRGRAGVALVAILLLWQAGGTAAAHPDHLAWFNEIARRNPDAWLADSNLDWGQDLLRLSRETRERKIESLRLAYFGTAIPERHKLPRIVPLREEEPATGWIAVSRQIKIGLTWKSEPAYTWLDPYEPVEVGKSILLYYVPPEGHPDWAR